MNRFKIQLTIIITVLMAGTFFGNAAQPIKSVTAKEIEVFGNDLAGRTVELAGTFFMVDNTPLQMAAATGSLPVREDDLVGFAIYDSEDQLFILCFASKARHARTLLQLKQGTSIRLIGKVRKVMTTYGLFVDTVVATASSQPAVSKMAGTTPFHPAVSQSDRRVTAKEIEVFGNDLAGRTVELAGTFFMVDNTPLQMAAATGSLPVREDDLVGFAIYDSEDQLFILCFASKARHARTLLQLKQGTSIRLIGKVRKVMTTYGLFVDDLQR